MGEWQAGMQEGKSQEKHHTLTSTQSWKKLMTWLQNATLPQTSSQNQNPCQKHQQNSCSEKSLCWCRCRVGTRTWLGLTTRTTPSSASGTPSLPSSPPRPLP